MRSQNPIVRRISAATIGRLRLMSEEEFLDAMTRTMFGFLIVCLAALVVTLIVLAVYYTGILAALPYLIGATVVLRISYSVGRFFLKD